MINNYPMTGNVQEIMASLTEDCNPIKRPNRYQIKFIAHGTQCQIDYYFVHEAQLFPTKEALKNHVFGEDKG